MPANPIYSPSAYSVSRAVAYADADRSALLVTAGNPLPVSIGAAAAASPLLGSATTSAVAGPFNPVVGRAVVLSLQGVWQGTVKVLRSTDGGATRQPLTVGGAAWAQFAGNCCEPVWDESEASAQLFLDIALVSGSVIFRLGQ